MKKYLLLLSIAGLACASHAEGVYYWNFPGEDLPMYGTMRRVSANGHWAAGADYIYYTGGYIVDTTNPSELITTPDGEPFDISDSGLAVGCMYERVGESYYLRAATFDGSVWIRIDTHPEMASQSYATAITPDGKHIAGMAWSFDKVGHTDATDMKGRYYPCLWTLNEATGEYEVEKLYNDIELPKNQGMFIYDMTADASVLCGYMATDAGGSVPAMIRDGKLEYWNKFETRFVQQEYNGKVIWSGDVYFTDGAYEGATGEYFEGMFDYCHGRYLFGNRTIVSNVSDDGEDADYGRYMAIYDLETNEFIDYKGMSVIMAGLSPEEYFTSAGKIFKDGDSEPIDDFFNVTSARVVAGVYSLDDAGKVFGCSSIHFNDAIGEYYESPVLVIFDQPVVGGISDVIADAGNKASVVVNGREIQVSGAKQVAVYSMSGRLLSCSASTSVPAGAYLVVADGKTEKIMVR